MNYNHWWLQAFVMMTIQAHDTNLHPKPCGGKASCMEGGIGVMFYTSLALLALGTGGVRGALAAFGADQFDITKPKGKEAQGSYFNWLLLSTTTGAIVGVTGFVWVSTKHGWWWGFCLATISSFLGYSLFLMGKPFYQIHVPKDSPFLSIGRVLSLSLYTVYHYVQHIVAWPKKRLCDNVLELFITVLKYFNLK